MVQGVQVERATVRTTVRIGHGTLGGLTHRTIDASGCNGPCREYLRQRGIRHTISEKADSRAAGLRKGSRGGRPPGFDEERYKQRNTIERAINRLKQHRAVATRYDKAMSSSAPPPRQPL
ncbi:hypothetical protein [Streptomyces sp. NPDC055006]